MRKESETVAAIIAAVEAYLESERAAAAASDARAGGVSAWRMAFASGGNARGFGANVSWRGRDG